MNVTPFSIKSCASDRELLFHTADRDYFVAELRDLALSASIRVYAPIDMGCLSVFFARLASHELPWSDPIQWESLEGQLRLEARCSRLGNVSFIVHMRHDIGGTESWNATAGIESELGLLPSIASAAERFFQTC